MTFLGHTYFVDRTIALDVEESPMVVAFEALCRPVVVMVKGCLLSPIRLVGPSSIESLVYNLLLPQFQIFLSSFASTEKSASIWIIKGEGGNA